MTLISSLSDPVSEIIDTIFRDCGDDAACIATAIKNQEPEIRDEILSSDLLNAWQVFYYHFADYPGDEAVEFLVFHPAGELSQGVPMGEIDIFTLSFSVIRGEPVISISDDIREVARYTGTSAWTETLRFLDEG